MKYLLTSLLALAMVAPNAFAQIPGMMSMPSAQPLEGTTLGANETIAYDGIALGNRVKLRGYVDFIYNYKDDATGDDAGGESGTSEKPKSASAAVAVQRVDAQRASENLASGDAKATSRTLQGLNLPNLKSRSTPTPAAISNSLQQVRQRIMSGAPPR